MTDSDSYAALTGGCAVVHLPAAPWTMTGPDRARFLNGLVTCAVAQLEAGTGRYGFFTSAKGKVLSDVAVLATDDRFLLRLPAEAAAPTAEHVLRHRITDRVELDEMAGTGLATVAGPGAAATLEGLTGAPPQRAWEHREGEIAGVPLRLARRSPSPVPAWDLWLPAEGAGAVLTALTDTGAAKVDPAAWDVVRVEHGAPAFGRDFGTDHLPQESGLEEAAVSYDKGCYVGQEVVARVHYRGGVNRGLAGLDLGDAPPPAPDVHPAVLHDGRPAGIVGTAARSPALGRTLALSVLHRRAAEPGTEVEVEGVGPAAVRTLPFI